MNSKPLVKSKTFWVNLVSTAVALITTISGSELIQENPQLTGIAAVALAVGNILLRLVTKEPVTIN